jgi:hypothetical protein
VIDDAGPQGEVSVEERIRNIHAPAANDAVEDLAVQLVPISRSPGIAKTHGTECNRCKPFESRISIHTVGQDLREAQVLRNGFGKYISPVIPQ